MLINMDNLFKLIPLGRGYYHVLINNMENQSTATTAGPVNTNPGVFRVTRWTPDFNTGNMKNNVTQVWLKIFYLALEYRKPQTLFNNASGAGFPLKIDPRTLALEQGLYARVLIEVDIANPLPDKILVKNGKSDFVVRTEFERLPVYCTFCNSVGHGIENCNKKREDQYGNRSDSRSFNATDGGIVLGPNQDNRRNGTKLGVSKKSAPIQKEKGSGQPDRTDQLTSDETDQQQNNHEVNEANVAGNLSCQQQKQLNQPLQESEQSEMKEVMKLVISEMRL